VLVLRQVLEFKIVNYSCNADSVHNISTRPGHMADLLDQIMGTISPFYMQKYSQGGDDNSINKSDRIRQ
jgi:hypothetical protein